MENLAENPVFYKNTKNKLFLRPTKKQSKLILNLIEGFWEIYNQSLEIKGNIYQKSGKIMTKNDLYKYWLENSLHENNPWIIYHAVNKLFGEFMAKKGVPEPKTNINYLPLPQGVTKKDKKLIYIKHLGEIKTLNEIKTSIFFGPTIVKTKKGLAIDYIDTEKLIRIP